MPCNELPLVLWAEITTKFLHFQHRLHSRGSGSVRWNFIRPDLIGPPLIPCLCDITPHWPFSLSIRPSFPAHPWRQIRLIVALCVSVARRLALIPRWSQACSAATWAEPRRPGHSKMELFKAIISVLWILFLSRNEESRAEEGMYPLYTCSDVRECSSSRRKCVMEQELWAHVPHCEIKLIIGSSLWCSNRRSSFTRGQCDKMFRVQRWRIELLHWISQDVTQ